MAHASLSVKIGYSTSGVEPAVFNHGVSRPENVEFKMKKLAEFDIGFEVDVDRRGTRCLSMANGRGYERPVI